MQHEPRPLSPAWPHARALGACLAVVCLGCATESPTGPGGRAGVDVLVLNSTGQTLAPFAVAEGLTSGASSLDLGPSFDGQSVDVAGDLAVSTVSSFGGSLIVLADLSAETVTNVEFLEPEARRVNPSAPAFDDDGTVWVGGRGSDAVYRLSPESDLAEEIAAGVGTFVERVLPVGDLLYVVDANLDDDGLTYRPLGPGRLVVLSRDGATVDEIVFPQSVVNAFDAVRAGDDLIVLATGSFDESLLPAGDGHLVVVDLAGRSVRQVLPLGANGLTLELGGDGDVYVTTTLDNTST